MEPDQDTVEPSAVSLEVVEEFGAGNSDTEAP